MVRLLTGTGRGYGPLEERILQLVREDVLEGLITTEKARKLYRTVLDENFEVHREGTRRLREGESENE